MSTPSDFGRRMFLRSVSSGFGALAFAALGAARSVAETSSLAAKATHFPVRARRVLMLTMDGAPSHVDTFDYRPELAKFSGKPIGKGRVPTGRLLASPWKFKQHGKGGLWISELFPRLAQQADKLCLIHSMMTDIPAHPAAFLQMHTGLSNTTRPSLGAWLLYGLGTANENLPGFITISAPVTNGGPQNFGSAFLPSACQGTRIGMLGQAVKDVRLSNLNSPLRTPAEQQQQLELLRTLAAESRSNSPSDDVARGLLEAHELAFRMQGELPGVLDLARESNATQVRYGIDGGASENFGRQCLMARRLLEAGVRFVEVCHGGWDQHRKLKEDLANQTLATDEPIAGLLADLAERGLLKDTLVIWAGEFGRTPYGQGGDGRDHNHTGYTTWMAGGGVKGGFAYGRTDEFGLEAIENTVHIHDWHATILHLLGLDHERLTFRHAGRDVRLTDVKGNVAQGLIG